MTIGGARLLMTTDAVGGVWTYTLDLASGFAVRGADVRIATLGPPLRGDQRAELARRGLDVVETHLPLEWLARDEGDMRASAQVISDLARAWRADVVHLHSPAFAATAAFRCPVVAVNHSCVATWWACVRGDPLPGDFRWRADMIGAGLRDADLALVPTRAYAQLVADVYGLARAPRVVWNGRAADAIGAEPERDEVFTAGRLWDEGKNIRALDRAATLLPRPVVAAGDTTGPNGAGVTTTNLTLLGRLGEAEIRRRLAGRPIYASPARFEPFGLAVLEAAQGGCALVLNDIATFRELWDGAALFVDADDPVALAGALRGLIEDRGRRRALGLAAQRRAAGYTAEAMVAGTLAAYARGGVLAPEAALSA